MKDSKIKESIPEFSRNQLHIMQILWDSEDALKPAEIGERFNWSIDNATLRSTLKGLLDKGDLKRKQQGKAYYYFPTKRKRNALSSLASGLAEVFAKGSKAGLIAQLIQDTSLSNEERAELEKITRGESGDIDKL